MLRNTRLRLALAAALGGVTVLAGLCLALPLSWPGGWRLDQPRLATVSEARALAAADGAGAPRAGGGGPQGGGARRGRRGR